MRGLSTYKCGDGPSRHLGLPVVLKLGPSLLAVFYTTPGAALGPWVHGTASVAQSERRTC